MDEDVCRLDSAREVGLPQKPPDVNVISGSLRD